MNYMKKQPDKVFDLAICDPPYGIKADAHRVNNRSKLAKSKKYHKALWDQSPPSKKYFAELFRISKNQIIFGANNYPQWLKKSNCWLVWDKDNTGDFADCELAYTSFNTAVRKIKIRWNGMLQYDMRNREHRIHPTQKPIPLYKWILKNYTRPGDKIFDSHGGSMSSVIACLDMGFDITVCEIDKIYYDAAIKRINDYKKQLKLF